jgi:glycosyltransferase involved in cell wall biosynthesis
MPLHSNAPGVLILINVRWWNATAFYAVNVARILHKNGHRVYLGCDPCYPAFQIAGTYGLQALPLSFYGFHPAKLRASFGTMLRAIRSKGIQIINSHRSEDHTFAYLAKICTGAKMVITRGDQRPISRNPLSRFRYGASDAIILTCQSIFEQNRSVLAGMDHKIHTIYGSVDEDHFKRPTCHRAAADKFGIDPRKKVVGLVGRLSRVKDPMTFILAAARVLEERRDVAFVIAGKEIEISLSQLHQKLMELRIAEHFVLLPVIDDIAALMDALDIGVITSIGSETISRVLLELMYLGKPVIGTRVNAIGEIIRPGFNGQLIAPGDHLGLAAAISELLGNDTLRNAFGLNSQSLYQASYAETVFYQSYLKVFESLGIQ